MQKSIGFYADVGEVFSWINELITKNDMKIAYATYFPKYEVSIVSKIEDISNQKIIFNNLLFRASNFNLRSSKQLDFLSDNPDTIIYHNSIEKDNAVRESSIGVVSDKQEILKITDSLIRKIRKQTNSGMWVANHDLKTKGYYNHLHYSELTKERYKNGLILRPFAGGNRVYIYEDDIVFGE